MQGHEIGSSHWREGRMPFRAFMGVVVAALLAAAVAACGGGNDQSSGEQAASAGTVMAKDGDLVAAARKKGTLNFYTSADPATAKKLADTFGKKYGIKVTYTRLTSGPVAARYNAEAQSGNVAADAVMIADTGFFRDAKTKGWMIPITADNVPAVSTLDKKFHFNGSVGIGVSRLDGVVVNTNVVKPEETPKTWQDLLDPKWKGNLLTDDPRTIPVVLGQWKLLDDTYGDDYLKAISQQGVQWTPSLVTGVQSVAAGERQAAFGANLLHVAPLTSTAPDAPVKLTHLTGIDFGFTWNAGVSAKSPNPAAGRLFVNWLLSREGQQIFNGPGNNSVLPSVSVKGSPPLTSKFVTLTSEVPDNEKSHILSLLGLSG